MAVICLGLNVLNFRAMGLHNIQLRGFETFWDLAIWRLTAYCVEALLTNPEISNMSWLLAAPSLQKSMSCAHKATRARNWDALYEVKTGLVIQPLPSVTTLNILV